MDQANGFTCAQELVDVLCKELPGATPQYAQFQDTPMVRYHVPWGSGQLRIVIAEKPANIEAYVYAVDAAWLVGERIGEIRFANALDPLIPKGDWMEIAFWTLSRASTSRQQRRLGLAIAEIVYNAFGID